MRKLLFISVLTIGLSFNFTRPAIGQNESNIDPGKADITMISYEELYDQLRKLAPDPERVARVDSLTLQRDVAQFHLKEGELYWLTPFRKRTMAAIFVGKGVFSFSPPTQIEKDQLYRFYKTSFLEKKFDRLFLIFADTTSEELTRRLTFSHGKIQRALESYIPHALEFVSDKGKYFDTDMMKTFLENEQNGLFYAQFSENEQDPLFFEINPFAVEEVCLMRRAETLRFYKIPEVVCQFHKQADYVSGKDVTEENKNLIQVDSYKIESTIPGNLKFSAVAKVEFTSLKPEQSWVYFMMYSDMEVDSVFWNSGQKVTFFKEKENPILWIQCDPPLGENEPRAFKVFYHGDLLERDAYWIHIKSSTGWYPRYGIRKAATFDLTFHTSEKFQFVSVGDKMHSQVDDGMITTRWVTPKPVNNAAFNLGFFKEYQVNNERIPPMTVLMTEHGHEELARYLISQGILSGKDMEKQVGADIANSLAFFQEVFGKPFVNQFYATEIPYLHGEAFPGMIHLSWWTFQQTGTEGYDEIFRAHEVAHQWWGIGVDFKTYHDQWLSEGFAQFAGLWYMQTVLQDNKKYFNALKDWRKKIFDNRKYLLGSGQEAGPIWLGYRTSTSKTEGDYDLIIYKKGAWVLHMLRNLMLDLKTMKEDYFKNMMRDFYRSYLGKKASTKDFQKMVEKYAGTKMDWFFDQWVYGTDLPEYHFSYKTEKTAQDKYLVRCKVKQEGVPDDFQMYVPLFIDFGKDRFARLRYLIKGPVSELELPLMPLKPEKIIFNDLESVLCKVEYENWKE